MTATIRQMATEVPITVTQDDELALAQQVMVWSDVRHLPIMAADRLVGVLSERDLLRRYAEVGRQAAGRERVAAVMSSPPVTIGPDDEPVAAAKLLADRGIGCLPVVDRGRLLGIVTRRDLLAETARAPLGAEAEATGDPSPNWTRLSVDDVMSPDPLVASPDDTLKAVIDRMGRQGIRHLPVVDSERRVVGMISDRDVRTAIGNPARAFDRKDAVVRIESTRVSRAMSRGTLSLRAGTRLARAAALFADHKVGAVPIVDEGARLVGLVSYTDVLRAVVGPKPNLS